MKAHALEALIAEEHAVEWQRYLANGSLPELDDEDDDEGMRDLSSWDGLLCPDDEDDDPESAPTAEELALDEGPYDPLPGFEET